MWLVWPFIPLLWRRKGREECLIIVFSQRTGMRLWEDLTALSYGNVAVRETVMLKSDERTMALLYGTVRNTGQLHTYNMGDKSSITLSTVKI